MIRSPFISPNLYFVVGFARGRAFEEIDIDSRALIPLGSFLETVKRLVFRHTPVREIKSIAESIPRWIGQSLPWDHGRGGPVELRLQTSVRPLIRFATMLFCFDCRRGIVWLGGRGIGGILSSPTADWGCGKQWRCSTGHGANLASETDRATQCRGREHEGKLRTERGLKSRREEFSGTQGWEKAGGLDPKNLLTLSTYTTPGRHLTTVLGYFGAVKDPKQAGSQVVLRGPERVKVPIRAKSRHLSRKLVSVHAFLVYLLRTHSLLIDYSCGPTVG